MPRLGHFSVTVNYVTKLKLEKLARHTQRSESWITEKAIKEIEEKDLKP